MVADSTVQEVGVIDSNIIGAGYFEKSSNFFMKVDYTPIFQEPLRLEFGDK